MSQTKLRVRCTAWCLAMALLAAAGSSVQAQDVLDSTVQVQTRINQEAARSQQRINQLADEAEDLAGQYRQVLRETETLRIYNEQLGRIVQRQREEIAGIDAQLEAVAETDRGIIPLMLEMIDTFEQIVRADVPFRIDERLGRAAALRDIIDRADVTTSEKYRRIMEAYQVEMEFGRTTEAYQAPLGDTGRTVDFLRIGRTLLFYQTLDGTQSGWFNPGTRQFEALPAIWNASVRDGLRIARNQAAPDLVTLPVPAPEQAQ